MSKNDAGIVSKKWLSFMVGVLVTLALLVACHLLAYAFAKQTRLSCHKLAPTITQTEYCVYHTKVPGLLTNRNNLLIGPSPSRGIVYAVPYGVQDIAVRWDEETDRAIITMPGTQLTIGRDTYIDSR